MHTQRGSLIGCTVREAESKWRVTALGGQLGRPVDSALMDWILIVQTITAAAVVTVAVAAIVVAAAMIRLAGHHPDLSAETRKLVDNIVALLEAASAQAQAAREQADETHMDCAVATGPLLVLLDEPPAAIRAEPWAAVRVRNLGSGPALNVVVWMLARGKLFRSAGAAAQGFTGILHLASGDTFEPGPFHNMVYVGKAHERLDPGSAVVGDTPSTSLAAYCADKLGDRYRFNLRTADLPDLWARGADAPPWAGAWDPPLGLWARPQIADSTLITPLPEHEVAPLVDALHEVLHALHDAAAAD